MNAEKELLLSLLVEKYSCQKIQTVKTVQQRAKKFQLWSDDEIDSLLYYRHVGYSFAKIATLLGNSRTTKTCQSQWSNFDMPRNYHRKLAAHERILASRNVQL